MIQIPPELAEEHIRSSYFKGDVLFWEAFPGKEKQRDSFFVLLTDCRDNLFLVARATRRVQLYSGPQSHRLGHEIILIKKGEAEVFPEDTILDLTWRRFFEVAELAKLLGGQIKKEESLPQAIIERIDNVVKNSVTLSQREISLILSCDRQRRSGG